MKDPILQSGAPVLRQKAHPVAKKDIGSRKLDTLISKMKKILAGEKHGVAIAAPQIGVSLQLFVVAGKVFEGQPQSDDETTGHAVEASEEARKHVAVDRIYINPKLTRSSRAKKEMSEGCLSVRGKYGAVKRHEKVTLHALSEKGMPTTYHASGLLAQIFQHECDHLNGVLYIDKAVKLTDEDIDTSHDKEF